MNLLIILTSILAGVILFAGYSGRLAWNMGNALLDEWADGNKLANTINIITTVVAFGLFLFALYGATHVWGLMIFGGTLTS